MWRGESDTRVYETIIGHINCFIAQIVRAAVLLSAIKQAGKAMRAVIV
jgi:hypothetical protein